MPVTAQDAVPAPVRTAANIAETRCSDLRFEISQIGPDFYTSLVLKPIDSNAPSELVAGAKTALDLKRLHETASFDDYAALLTEMVFVEKVKNAWRRAKDRLATNSAPIRVRLIIRPNDANELHGVCWEALRDPYSGVSICHSQRMFFSRYLAPITTVCESQRARAPGW